MWPSSLVGKFLNEVQSCDQSNDCSSAGKSQCNSHTLVLVNV